MGVPTTGNFSMFGTGDNTTIQGAIEEGGGTTSGVTNFNTLKGLADINLFDTNFSEGATTLGQITKATQFRGYPIAGGTVVAAIRLINAGCGGDSSLFYQGRMYLDVSEFSFTNFGGYLRVNNSTSINTFIPLQTYNPSDPGITEDPDSLTSTGTIVGPGTYLIQDDSLTTTGNDVEVVINLSGEASLQTCGL